jgi:hypothetical protein
MADRAAWSILASWIIFLRAYVGHFGKGNYLVHWDGQACFLTPWPCGRKWSRGCPFTGKDFLERHVLALELLRISSRIATVIMVLLEGKYDDSSTANGIS